MESPEADERVQGLAKAMPGCVEGREEEQYQTGKNVSKSRLELEV